MGLIENAARIVKKSNIGPKVLKALPLLSILSCLAGIIWLAVLPMAGQFRGTYVSENALLPHQASTHFRESEWHIVRGFRSEIRDFSDRPEEERNARLMELFDEIGLKSTSHEWQNCTEAHSRGENCQNVYSILHAPRGSHNEAIVLVAPWLNMDGVFNDGGLALLVSLARYLKKWSVWHKNLIFVVPSNSYDALRSWVGAYHTSLKYTAGSVEGAIVLDFPDTSERFDHLDIYYDGLNGQLPNLDLLNALVRIADSEYVRTEIMDSGASYHLYEQRLRTMVKGITRQIVAGIKSGSGCEMFSGWRIDAITLRARGHDGHHDITTFGRVVESLVRSINNLLEHFHQSFFFYLMLGPRYFVSIGTYLPGAMLVSNSFPIMAIYVLLTARQSFSPKSIISAIGSLGTVVAVCTLLSYLTVGVFSDVKIRALVLAASVAVSSGLRGFLDENSKQLLFGITLILYGLSLTTLAMLNFSLALALGVVSFPLAWIRRIRKRRKLVLALTCPATVLAGVAYYLDMSLPSLLDALIYAHKELEVWTWLIIAQIWLPFWLLMVVVA